PVRRKATATVARSNAASFQRGSRARSGDGWHGRGSKARVMVGCRFRGRTDGEEKSPRRCRRGPPPAASGSTVPRGPVPSRRTSIFRLEFGLGLHPVLHVGAVRPAALHPLLVRPHGNLVVRDLHLGRGGRSGGRSHDSGHLLSLLEVLTCESGSEPRRAGIAP